MDDKVFFDGDFGKICGVLHKVDTTSEIVIIVHGFASNKTTAAAILARELNGVGLNALRIDLDNRGESDMDFLTHVSIPNNVKQIRAAILYCQDLGYDEISLIGTSFGGISCFATALKCPDIKRMCLRAPVIDYQKHVERNHSAGKLVEFKEVGAIPFKLDDGVVLEHTYDTYESAKNYSMYEHASELKIPTLIIQGTADEAVFCEWAKEVIDLFPKGKLCLIEGANHSLAVDGDYSVGQNVLLDFFRE